MNQETTIHTLYLPWLAKVDALIGKPARLDLARHTSFGGVARGPQPARGGRRCQEPLECPTLATLADALEAIGVNGRTRPGTDRDAGGVCSFIWSLEHFSHLIDPTSALINPSLDFI
jgi:hypothetical protein